MCGRTVEPPTRVAGGEPYHTPCVNVHVPCGIDPRQNDFLLAQHAAELASPTTKISTCSPVTYCFTKTSQKKAPKTCVYKNLKQYSCRIVHRCQQKQFDMCRNFFAMATSLQSVYGKVLYKMIYIHIVIPWHNKFDRVAVYEWFLLKLLLLIWLWKLYGLKVLELPWSK